MTCKDCVHDGVCYMQEVCNDIEEQLEEFGCNDFKDRTKYVEQKQEQWIDGAFENSKRCPACGKYATKIHVYSEPAFDYEFCPYCGCYMKKEMLED